VYFLFLFLNATLRRKPTLCWKTVLVCILNALPKANSIFDTRERKRLKMQRNMI
jgi:hypothetical protein